MSPLPIRKRPRLTQPPRRWSRRALAVGCAATWRLLHPGVRERFVDRPRPEALRRLYYTTSDGWRAPLRVMQPPPGSAGEPIVLAHGLGSAADALRLGQARGLANTLREAGYTVYLWSHRADADAIPPDSRAPVRLDDILARDLPAAVAAVLEDSDARRLHFVGHALGGVLGACWATGRPDGLASLTLLGAPMAFDRPRTRVRAAARALGWLPGHWRLPTRTAARAGATLLEHPVWLDAPGACGATARSVCMHGASDLHAGVVHDVLAWMEHGSPTSAGQVVDYAHLLHRGSVPLLVVCGGMDQLVPAAHALVAAERWGDEAVSLCVPGLGHGDLLWSEQAPRAVFEPLLRWLSPLRRRAWLDVSTPVAIIDSKGAACPVESGSPATSSSATARSGSEI